MKKLLAFAALFAVVALTSCKYDDDDLWNSVHGLENRVAKLEELCKQMNTNIASLQTIVTALQNNVYVTGTTPFMQDGKEIGYTITFSKGNPITIYHGKDGQDGQDGEDGTTPTIGVKKDTDGVYYWSGIPICVKTKVDIIKPAPGTPAVPTAANTPVITTMTWSPRDNGRL